MDAHDDVIPLSDAIDVVEAMNRSLTMTKSPRQRAVFLLSELQRLLNRPQLVKCVHVGIVNREGPPHVKNCYHVAPEREDPVQLTKFLSQQATDANVIVNGPITHDATRNLNVPSVVISSLDLDRDKWRESEFYREFLRPMGYEDEIAGGWAATPERGVGILLCRREQDPEFNERDRAMMSLVLRGVAPIIDRDLSGFFARLHNKQLTPRQRQVLTLMLTGDSEKQIALSLNLSRHTIHKFVRQLYEIFDVSSRGELMAIFVDQAVFESKRFQKSA